MMYVNKNVYSLNMTDCDVGKTPPTRKKRKHTNCAFKYFCCKELDFPSVEYTWLLDELQRMIDDKRKKLGICSSL